MTRTALLIIAAALALCGCHSQASEASQKGNAGPTSANTVSGQPSGANGTPSGQAQT
jgi:hypothetical protein